MLAVHERVTECGVLVTPVPVRGIVRVGLDALLVTVIEPLAAPVTVGVNVAVSVFDAPAARVNAVGTDVRVNPGPEIDTAETITDVPPVLVTIAF